MSGAARLHRANYRGRTVSLLGGIAALAAVVVLGVVTYGLAHGRVREAGLAAAVAALGAGAVGWYDDRHDGTDAKGLAGHLGALLRGKVTTGTLKIVVVGGAALLAAAVMDRTVPRTLVDAALVAGTANLVNLFDLRPGRALKVVLLVLLAVPKTALVAWLGVVAAVLLPGDLRERTMLGDAGANALGAALGVAIALGTRTTAVALAEVAALAVLTVASEFVSFSAVIERVAPLRWLDRLGRAA